MKIKEGGGMDIKNTIISAKVVIESLVALLENEDVDISSIKFKVGSQEEGYESEDMSFESLINLTMKGLEEAKAQAVPEGFVLVPMCASEETKQKMLIVFNESDGFLNCENIYKAMIEAQEPAND